MLFTCSLEQLEAQASFLLVQSSEARMQALQSPLIALSQLLSNLAQANVHLVLCTQSCSPEAAALCTEAGMRLVPAVDSRQALAAVLAAGVTTCTSLGAVLAMTPDEVVAQHVGFASCAREVACHGATGSMSPTSGVLLELGQQVGEADVLHVSNLEVAQRPARESHIALLCAQQLPMRAPLAPHTQASSLLVAAPSEAAARQYTSLLHAALKTLLTGHTSPGSSAPGTLCLAPGGLAFDSYLAAHLKQQITLAQCCTHSIADPRMPSQAAGLLPALKVLHALASACPTVMAHAAVGALATNSGIASGISQGRHDSFVLVSFLIAILYLYMSAPAPVQITCCV